MAMRGSSARTEIAPCHSKAAVVLWGSSRARSASYFESDRLDRLVGELEAKGVVFEQQPTDQAYLWREAVLRDPDGHRLFLYHAGVNRLDPPRRLS
jgi:catechol 2,3-dioxygenase-like lactoylglutathione lyase family enzyme